jgi:hypothetical protein
MDGDDDDGSVCVATAMLIGKCGPCGVGWRVEKGGSTDWRVCQRECVYLWTPLEPIKRWLLFPDDGIEQDEDPFFLQKTLPTKKIHSLVILSILSHWVPTGHVGDVGPVGALGDLLLEAEFHQKKLN